MTRQKRLLDWAIALPILLLISPLIAVIGVLVAMDGGPVFYGHRRVGENGKPFNCYKFRTMIVGAHDLFDEYLGFHPAAVAEWAASQKLDGDPRITSIGRWLRRTSLDELPQLLNVIMGDMSLVGPRPVTESELARYGDKADIYKAARPGITGLWQVSGRNRLSYDERVALDVQYVSQRALWRDIVILGRTIRVLLTGDGK